MAKRDYAGLAKSIVELVGGTENIESLHHCQTRLRFGLRDEDKAQTEKITALDGVVTALMSGGMYQVVIGMDVADVYDEVVKITGDLGAENGGVVPDDSAEDKKRTPFDVIADFISGIFSPIVPALAGAGMDKALLAVLVAFSLVSPKDQTYVIINMIGDATFAFLPILLAYSTAQKLKCNPVLAAVTAGIMCHATWTGLVTTGDPVTLFGFLPLYLIKYTGSVIPIVLVILVQAPLEKFLNRIVPKSIRLVIVPMVVFLVMGILALAVIGPVGDWVGTIFTAVFTWLSTNAAWLEVMLMAGTYSILVIFGLHHGLAPLGTMQLASMGYDAVFGPGVLCANIGQGIASLVCGLTSHDEKTREIGTSAGITGLMGITEPALYGINVPKKYPLVCGAIGAACGGLFAGICHVHRFATGSSGLPAIPMYIGDNTLNYMYEIIIALAITSVVTGILTFIMARKEQKAAEKATA